MARSPKEDPQREEVYAWERNFAQLFYDHELKYRAMHRLARGMAEIYGVRKPRLEIKRMGPMKYLAAATGDELLEINASRIGPTAIVLAHELAHVVVHAHGILEAPHGRKWLGVYLWLLDKFAIIPACASVPSARKAGLKFAKLDSVAPGAL